MNLKKKIDRQEQYSRRNCVLIHGIEENRDENTDELVNELVNEKLIEEISLHDIDRSHRLGR